MKLTPWSFKVYTFLKIPLLAVFNPHVRVLDEKHCEIDIRNWWFTRNHLGSLYFGAYAMAADACVGLLALKVAESENVKAVLVFKDFKAEFLKRAYDDVVMICDEGDAISAMIQKMKENPSERQTQSIKARAISGDVLVGTFELGLSLKGSGNPS